MSHFTRVRTTLREAKLLAAALKEVGFAKVEVHETPQQLHGWGGGLGAERAQVIVRREHTGGASSDIGFARQNDGSFAAMVDAMDRHRFGEAWLDQLSQAYGYATALQYADAHGFEVATDDVEQDGTRRLTLRRVS